MYSYFNSANLFIIQHREWEIINALRRCAISKLDDKKIFDLGCGSGGELRNFIRYGARPENCSGVDLLPERVESAKKISPNIDFRCGDASRLPFEDGSFDIVIQFTVFTSILDTAMKRSIATEMLRVFSMGNRLSEECE